VFGPVDPHELRHFAGHHLYVTMGLPSRVVGTQLGDTPRMIEDLYGHGDVGALDEIDRAIGDDVVPLRRAAGE
jgi:hypothetical protein